MAEPVMTDPRERFEKLSAAAKAVAKAIDQGLSSNGEDSQEVLAKLEDAVVGLQAARADIASGASDRGQSDGNPPGWRCFHCGEYFANPNLARAHFGEFTGTTPACIIKAEQGLVYLLRDQERQLMAYRSGETDLIKEVHALGATHAVALIREEEKGYARGLADGRAHSQPDEALRKAVDVTVRQHIGEGTVAPRLSKALIKVLKAGAERAKR